MGLCFSSSRGGKRKRVISPRTLPKKTVTGGPRPRSPTEETPENASGYFSMSEMSRMSCINDAVDVIAASPLRVHAKILLEAPNSRAKSPSRMAFGDTKLPNDGLIVDPSSKKLGSGKFPVKQTDRSSSRSFSSKKKVHRVDPKSSLKARKPQGGSKSGGQFKAELPGGRSQRDLENLFRIDFLDEADELARRDKADPKDFDFLLQSRKTSYSDSPPPEVQESQPQPPSHASGEIANMKPESITLNWRENDRSIETHASVSCATSDEHPNFQSLDDIVKCYVASAAQAAARDRDAFKSISSESDISICFSKASYESPQWIHATNVNTVPAVPAVPAVTNAAPKNFVSSTATKSSAPSLADIERELDRLTNLRSSFQSNHQKNLSAASQTTLIASPLSVRKVRSRNNAGNRPPHRNRSSGGDTSSGSLYTGLNSIGTSTVDLDWSKPSSSSYLTDVDPVYLPSRTGHNGRLPANVPLEDETP